MIMEYKLEFKLTIRKKMNSMSDIIEVTQKSAPASNSTQIGVQYIGMTPEQAARQTIALFMDNFPKLQALAKDTAEQRATELCNEILKKLEDKQVRDFTPFTQPDVQFVLYEAQKNYARFGEKEVMKILTELVVNRIQNDDKGHFKRIMDNAVIVASDLSSTQLDCLSALFMLTKVHFSGIKNIEDLKEFFNYISSIFNLENIEFGREFSYLLFKGCLQLELPDISKIQSELYNLDRKEVEENMSQGIKQFDTDYGVSEIGIILGLINAKQKSRYRFDPHIWIHD